MRRGLDPRTFLLLGLLAGVLAGLVAFGVAWLIGEPHVDAAIALEETAAHAHGHGEDELVSRGAQSTIGLLTGTLVIGAMLGGITGLVSALAMGRLGALRPHGSTAIVALLGFFGTGLVPFLKYPANPPAVGDPATIDHRTAYYFGFLAISVLLVIAGVLLARQLLPRYGGYRAVVLAAGATIVLLVFAGQLLPTVNEVGTDFPASLLWHFRLSSLVTLATLWSVLGVALTGLVGRVAGQVRAVGDRRAMAAAL